MTHLDRVAVHTADFAAQVAQDWNRIADIAYDPEWQFSDEAQIALAGYKRKLTAPLMAGGWKFYQMALNGRPGNAEQQRAAADAFGLAVVLTDAVDTIIDKGQVPEEERGLFLYGGQDVLLSGSTAAYEPTAHTPAQVALDIAAAFHRRIIGDDPHGRFRGALDIIVPAALNQFTAPTLEDQMEATIGVGEGTFAFAGAALFGTLHEDDLSQDELSAADEAIRGFGILAQCLDNADAREAKADREEQYSRTYIGQAMEEHVDMRRAQEDLLDAGLTKYNQARSALSAEQRAILDAVRLAIEARFMAAGYRRQIIHSIHGLRPLIPSQSQPTYETED